MAFYPKFYCTQINVRQAHAGTIESLLFNMWKIKYLDVADKFQLKNYDVW